MKDILIERSKRKTLAITISRRGEVKIKAPLKASLESIEKFYDAHTDWVERKLSEIQANMHGYEDVLNYKKLLYLGQAFTVEQGNIRKITFGDDGVIVVPDVPAKKLYAKLKNWYKALAKKHFAERMQYFYKRFKMKPTSTSLTNATGKWGSCTITGNIRLNWRLILLNEFCIDYVMIHELAHLIEQNHSARFWKAVELMMPEYKKAKMQLKSMAFVLEMFL